jgi:hypothetical protein
MVARFAVDALELLLFASQTNWRNLERAKREGTAGRSGSATGCESWNTATLDLHFASSQTYAFVRLRGMANARGHSVWEGSTSGTELWENPYPKRTVVALPVSPISKRDDGRRQAIKDRVEIGKSLPSDGHYGCPGRCYKCISCGVESS